jgi:AmmeMemoRadiSam system protein A
VDLGITAEEKQTLRQVVHETIEAVVHGGPIPRFTARGGNLAEHRGAFVTLEKNGQLRGCIGHIVADEPLISIVAQMAGAAALEDPRFPPVRPEELPDITFDISVLTPIRKLDRVEDIVIGRDGLIVSHGWARGLLLPQVAAEYGWDRETFLAQTCRKAGLPSDAWRHPETVIEVFSAEVFN